MRQRRSLFVVLPFGLCCLTLGLMLGRPAPGQVPAPAAAMQTEGRYRVTASSYTPGMAIVIDTATGHCWSRQASGSGGWLDLGSPATPRR